MILSRTCTVRRLFTAAAFALLAAAPGHRAAAQTVVDGGQTLNFSSDTTYSSGLIVGSTGTGTVNQTGGTVTVASTFTLGNNATGVGYYNLSRGTLNYTGSQFNVGNNGQGIFVQSGNSTVNITTLNLQSGTNSSYTLKDQAALNVTSIFSVKLGNTYNQNGGTATLTGSTFRVYGASVANISGGSLTTSATNANTGNLIGWFAGTGAGTLNLSGTGAMAFDGAALNVGLGETGIVNQSGTSSLTAAKGVVLGIRYTSGSTAYNGTGTYNLNGGTLTTASVSVAASTTVGTTTYAPGTGTLNLNGGTLAANGASTNFLSVTTANVRNGGAVINSNGFDVTVNQALVHSTISGDNATDGGLTKLGAGTLTLTGANTYTGQTTVNAGTLALGGGGRLYNNGTTAGAVVVNNGGTLRLDGTDTFGDASAQTPVSFTVNAGGILTDGNTFNTLNAVTLNGGTILANGRDDGIGAYVLAGTVTATGTTPSNLTAARDQGYVRLGANGANGTTASATFNVTDATGRLNVNAGLTNNFNSAGGLIKNGAGTLALNGSSDYTGPTQVNAGTLLVNGSTAAGTTITLATGATLGGAGTVNGAVNFGANAILAPGGTGGTGILTLGSGLSLTNTSTFAAELNGATAGTGYDRVAVLGNVALNGATLRLTLGYTPTPGDRLILLDNDGTDSIAGTFAGLANGSIINVNGSTAQIYYTGDTATGTIGFGNDVELVFLTPGAVPEPSTWVLVGISAGGLAFVTLRRRRTA